MANCRLAAVHIATVWCATLSADMDWTPRQSTDAVRATLPLIHTGTLTAGGPAVAKRLSLSRTSWHFFTEVTTIFPYCWALFPLLLLFLTTQVLYRVG